MTLNAQGEETQKSSPDFVQLFFHAFFLLLAPDTQQFGLSTPGHTIPRPRGCAVSLLFTWSLAPTPP